VDRAKLLRDAVEHSVAEEKEAARPQRRDKSNASRIALALLCVPLAAFAIYSFVAKPEFIWGPRTVVSPARTEATVRMSMFLLARRAELHKTRVGEYPASLREFSPDTMLGYRRTANGFEVTGSANGRSLVFRSSDNPAAFLGNSAELLQQKVGR
jgi:hypothetical protein